MAKGRSKLNSSYSQLYSSHSKPANKKPIFHYIILILIISTLIISIFTLVNVYQLRNFLVPKTINANDFFTKLAVHDETKKYSGVTPLNIVQINSNNIANLQTQIQGLDISYIGSFLIQYSDAIVIYDYNNDKINGIIPLQQQPQTKTQVIPS